MKMNILLEGPIGTGKTYCLGTALPYKDLFLLSLDPGIQRTIDRWTAAGLDTSRFHYAYIPQAITPWAKLEEGARKLNTLTMEQASNLKPYDRNEYVQFMHVYALCANFICDCHGKSWGAVDDWTDDRIFAIDGLTGLSTMASQLITGSKPIRTLPETGAAQQLIRTLVTKLTGDTSCTFILLSHMDREPDKLTGGTILTVNTIGNKLAPDIPKPFDEVILTKREGTRFFWSTDELGVDLKSRHLPYANNLQPTFAHFFEEDA